MLDLGVPALILRVVVAAALGGMIGIEREIDAKEAGFRTHMVLALGAALFGMISASGFDPFVTDGDTNVQIEVTRVAAAVAAGVGFLGAGAILKENGGIRGLTTAASIWLTAAVGLAVGLGFFWPAVAVTVAALLTLTVLRAGRSWVRRHLARDEGVATFFVEPGADAGEVLSRLERLEGVRIRSFELHDRDDVTRVRVELRTDPGQELSSRTAELGSLPGVAGLDLTTR